MIILDTNVLSEFMRGLPDPVVMAWVAQQETSELFVTTITQAEMYYGLALLPVGKRRTNLERAVRQVFEQDFQQRILQFDSAAAMEYGNLAAWRRQNGKPISQADAQIAAITSSQKAILATRNISDFCDCQLTLVNPWQ
ncbi:type II toxin-antitoxin system VapC family toxin [Tumidithrix elongata RA019]|uniref:Type II toxin-antitoxin system VapC family toxin n=1 Tax=Tumidithrix elongata BACA0141 TaxID=2716417 RepID=A0AAW9PXP5_9CYAN|nr:type II toxin-antitoxin system VapC family toxin [Tumidithrix elongata RA019]